jgi:hypothetical protein
MAGMKFISTSATRWWSLAIAAGSCAVVGIRHQGLSLCCVIDRDCSCVRRPSRVRSRVATNVRGIMHAASGFS